LQQPKQQQQQQQQQMSHTTYRWICRWLNASICVQWRNSVAEISWKFVKYR